MGYFDELPNTEPILPPVPTPPVIPTPPTVPAAPSVQPPIPGVQPTPPAPKEFKGLPVRAGGDRVFLLYKGKKYWVTTPQVYGKLGFKFGDEAKIDAETLAVIPEGEPIQ